MNLLDHLQQSKIIAIMRGLQGEQIDYTVEALVKGGIRFLEVTMNTAEATASTARLHQQYQDTIHLGAGTVLSIPMAKAAIEAGASYLITPNVDAEVIRYAQEQNVAIWPGGLTPTEIGKAYQLGVGAVKVFPISFYGPDYIKALRGPYDQLPLIAVGGVKINQFQSYQKAGAMAVGLGNHLIDPQLIESENYAKLTDRARRFLEAMYEGASR